MAYDYDLIVIGGGPGGYVAAIRALQLGLRVAVIEERDMGGTCLNRGCIPTKVLLHAAELYQSVAQAAAYGIQAAVSGLDYGRLAKKKDAVVGKLRRGIVSLIKNHGGVILEGRGSIQDRHTVIVEGPARSTLTTGKIIIATGSKPSRPPIPGLDGDNILDSDGVLALTACPERVIIIGGGVIGVEFATVFNGLGQSVALIEMMDALVPGMDADLSAALRASLEKKGVRVLTGSRVQSLQSGPAVACTCTNRQTGETETLTGDIALVAVGRTARSENLGLEQLGLQTPKGVIPVDENMETSIPGIYAVGDVTGRAWLAHAASAQGLIAAAHAAGVPNSLDDRIVPSCLYTSPEIAWVGLTEAEAIRRGYAIKTGRFLATANGRSLLMDEKEGFVKIITDAKTGEILGAHIMAARATDLIAEVCVAMKLESTIEEVADTIHPHPTISEMVMEAAHDVSGHCVHNQPHRKP
jgi:dihydrolipoamide dehydrogenase